MTVQKNKQMMTFKVMAISNKICAVFQIQLFCPLKNLISREVIAK